MDAPNVSMTSRITSHRSEDEPIPRQYTCVTRAVTCRRAAREATSAAVPARLYPRRRGVAGAVRGDGGAVGAELLAVGPHCAQSLSPDESDVPPAELPFRAGYPLDEMARGEGPGSGVGSGDDEDEADQRPVWRDLGARVAAHVGCTRARTAP